MARGAVRAYDIDGPPSHAVGAGSFPVCEIEILILHSIAWLELELRPVPVDVQSVGILVPDEVGEGALPDGAVASVGFDHEHLITIRGVYLIVGDMMNVCGLAVRSFVPGTLTNGYASE